MICRWSSIKQAVLALAAGTACFLLAACQPRTAPPAPVAAERPELFESAENYEKRGMLNKALEAYEGVIQAAPESEKAALALKRISEIYEKENEPGKALNALERIQEAYPDIPWMADVGYHMASIRFRIGEHRRSAAEALSWLERYPHHPLKRDMLVLLGDDFNAMGDKVEAFHWYLMAKTLWPDGSEEAAALDGKLNLLIDASGPILLRQFVKDAAGTPYAPRIYDRMARVYMEQGESEPAEDAARSLIRSTRDDVWKAKGTALMERLREAADVRQGVVGVLLPLTGPFDIYGKEVLKGIQLGMTPAGDISGKAGLTLLIRDTRGDPEATAAAFEELAHNRKVMSVIGPLSSAAAGAAAERAYAAGVPLITLSQREGIGEEGGMVFRNLLTPAQEIEGLVDAAIHQMGLMRFGILYPDNAYGRYCMKTFRDMTERMGGTVTAVVSYGVDQTDFGEQIIQMGGVDPTKARSSRKMGRAIRKERDGEATAPSENSRPALDYEAVFIPDAYQRIAMIAPQLVYYDVLGVQLLGTSAWQSPQLIEMARDYVQGAVFCSGFAPNADDPDVRAFTEAYRQNFDTDPDLLAANGYDTIRLLNGLFAEKPIRTRRDLADALRGEEGFKGVCGPVIFDSHGEAERNPILLKISGSAVSVFNQETAPPTSTQVTP